MVEKIRSMVYYFMQFKLFRICSIPPIAFGNLLRKEKQKYSIDYRKNINERIYQKYLNGNLTVLSGPFKGLEYPAFKSYTSTLIPKLIGTYESEIYQDVEFFLKKKYDQVIDIGAAEGYYAVGIAKNMIKTPVICYDVNPEALAFCKEMAELNQVDNLKIEGLFTTAHFDQFEHHKSLIICDVDGYEKALFKNKDIIQKLKNTDLIIETHDYVKADITKDLVDLFSSTHHCKVIPYKPNKVNELPNKIFKDATSEERRIAVLERIVDNKWIIAEAKNSK